jgi:acyl-ACP thioesterase
MDPFIVWRETVRLNWRDVDFRNRLRPAALLSMMQEAAGHDAARLGFGHDQIAPLGIAWVLARVSLEMKHWPGWDEELVVETWSRGAESLYGLRDFRFLDAAGNELGGASSVWLLINAAGRRPVRPDILGRPLPGEPARQALPGNPGKLAAQAPLAAIGDHRIAYADLDHYRHVNNASYVAMAMDCLPLDFLAVSTLVSLQVNYIAEALGGETLEFLAGEEEGGTQFVEACNRDRHQVAMRMRLRWSADARPEAPVP